MTTSKLIRGALMAALIAGCQSGAPSGGEPKADPTSNSDIQDALAALPEATVLMYTADGVPTYIVGELAKVGDMQTDDLRVAELAVRPALAPVLKAFRLTNDDLALRKVNVDDNGHRHFRFKQQLGGIDVVGADLVVHVDIKGAVYSVNGTARGDISAQLGQSPVSLAAANERIASDSRFRGLAVTGSRVVYIETEDGAMHKAYETIVAGNRGQDPARDKVYVDQDSGEIVAVHPQIHFAENRRIHTANNGTTLPGTLVRSEGQPASADVDINAAYDNSGNTYEAYRNFFNRDSFDNAGGALIQTVHYSTNYCNAFWNGSQMTYGDGNAAQGCGPLARSVDVVAHEMTHGVTERESNLTYSGESGGINESMSDVFGAFVEAWTDGGKNGTLTISTDTFLVGEDVIAGGLRFMCDPAADGQSKDLWVPGVGGVDVHFSSGISNLGFCLMSKGGTHPRGKTTTNVPAIGMDKAIRIYYKANVDLLTASSNYAALRTTTVQAAQQLGYDQATQDAVGCAWAAVGVGTAPASCGGTPPPPPPGDTILSNGVPVTGQSGALDSQKFYKLTVPSGQTSLVFTISGGTGDADLYTQFGAHPTLTSYTCRPYTNGNAETCTVANPQAGDYFVMLHGYAAYSGVTITGTYSGGGGGGDPYLQSGVPVTGLSGAAASAKYFRIAAPAGKRLVFTISGGTPDADLYTRRGSRPTTSTYDCRPYTATNTETCTVTSTVAADYYVMLRGYTSYSGVTLKATLTP